MLCGGLRCTLLSFGRHRNCNFSTPECSKTLCVREEVGERYLWRLLRNFAGSCFGGLEPSLERLRLVLVMRVCRREVLARSRASGGGWGFRARENACSLARQSTLFPLRSLWILRVA